MPVVLLLDFANTTFEAEEARTREFGPTETKACVLEGNVPTTTTAPNKAMLVNFRNHILYSLLVRFSSHDVKW